MTFSRQQIIDYTNQIKNLYKHQDLQKVLEDINQLPVEISPQVIQIEHAPRNKEINAMSLFNFLKDHNYFHSYGEITVENIQRFIDSLFPEEEQNISIPTEELSNQQIITQSTNEINNLYDDNELKQLMRRINSTREIAINLPIGNFKIRNAQNLAEMLLQKGYFNYYNSISKENINEFITPEVEEPISQNSVNNSSNFNFLPVQMQSNQPQQVNPLENFIVNTVTVDDLLGIYNRYAPNMLTGDELDEISGGNTDAAKAHLLETILTAARDGNLVRSGGGGFGTKRGMKELEKIILDLQRDVKRVTKAISPQGAQDIVDKHNRANPKNLWSLDTSDRNKDGIPDVVIQNSRGESMYVNGYTTKRSDWPHQYSYYYNFPTRKDRSGKPLSLFKKAFWQTNYTEDGDNYAK